MSIPISETVWLSPLNIDYHAEPPILLAAGEEEAAGTPGKETNTDADGAHQHHTHYDYESLLVEVVDCAEVVGLLSMVCGF